jgi:putative MATE family efflux protein
LPPADKKERPWQAIFRLALPSVAAGWLKAGFALADTLVAGRISTDALAGLTAATFFVWMFYSLSQTNSVGALSRIAQAFGSRDEVRLTNTFRLAVVWALIAGLFSSLMVGGGALFAMDNMALSTTVTQEARAYLILVFIGGPFFWIFDTLEQSFRAVGDARTPLWVTGLFVAANLLFNPLLAFGWGPIPAMGIQGIALATVLSWGGGAITLFAVALARGYFAGGTHWWGSPRPLWRVGLPTAVSMLVFDLIWVFLTPLLGRAGEPALGAVSIGHRLEALGYLTGMGISAATASLVGQAVGRGALDEVRGIARRAAIMVLSSTGLFTVLIVGLALPLFSLFSPDPRVQEVGRTYMWLAAAFAPLQALEVVMAGAFAGLGRTFIPMVLTILSYGLRIPISHLFFEAHREEAIFTSIGLTCALAGVAVTLAFIRIAPKGPSPTRPSMLWPGVSKKSATRGAGSLSALGGEKGRAG